MQVLPPKKHFKLFQTHSEGTRIYFKSKFIANSNEKVEFVFGGTSYSSKGIDSQIKGYSLVNQLVHDEEDVSMYTSKGIIIGFMRITVEKIN